MSFITQVAINICLERGENKKWMEREWELKIDQTVSCANIWKAFGVKETKDKVRQSEGRTVELCWIWSRGNIWWIVHTQTEIQHRSKLRDELWNLVCLLRMKQVCCDLQSLWEDLLSAFIQASAATFISVLSFIWFSDVSGSIPHRCFRTHTSTDKRIGYWIQVYTQG